MSDPLRYLYDTWCYIWVEDDSGHWEVMAMDGQVCLAQIQNGSDDRGHAIARAVECVPELLKMVREYGSKCEACGGSAEIVGNDRNGDPAWDHSVPCSTCKPIWDLIRKAEGG
jgi:hypothetical protein